MYREINSNSRFVAACVRSLEKENAKAIDDQQQQQPKSLDYSEHDSLVSTVTTTSTESKRSEKSNALERRYHLLYLRAFEIQCIYEGLLDKRNFLVLSEEFQQASTDSTESDEEPIAKIRKITTSHLPSEKNENCDDNEDELPSELCSNTNNGINKSNGNHQLEFDGDADFEDSEADEETKDMECVALKPSIDCVDSIIVPVKQPSPVKSEQQKIAVTPKSTGAVRRQKDFSKFNRSNRKSKNCAIFYYKHIDTDNDQVNNEDGKESEPTTISTETSEEEEEEIWEYSNVNGDDLGNKNNNEDECAVSDDKIQNFVVAAAVAAEDTKLDNCLPRNNDVNDTAKSPSKQSQQAVSNASNTTKVSLVCDL